MTCLSRLLPNHDLLGKPWVEIDSFDQLENICQRMYNEYVDQTKKFIAVTNPFNYDKMINNPDNNNFFSMPFFVITCCRQNLFDIAVSIAIRQATNIWHQSVEEQKLSPIELGVPDFEHTVRQVLDYSALQNQMISNNQIDYIVDFDVLNSKTDQQSLEYFAHQFDLPAGKHYINSCTKSNYTHKQQVLNYAKLKHVYNEIVQHYQKEKQ